MSVVGQLHHGTFAYQQLLGYLLVDEVVFHHQQTHAVERVAAGPGGIDQRCRSGCHSHRIGHRVVQHGACHGLDQKAIQRLLLVFGGSVQHVAAAGRDHDHDGPRAITK